MKPLEFSIKQPLFVNLLCIFIIFAGIIALKTMTREMFPNVTYDMVIVTTTYDGATPRDVEKLITIPLEKELKEVDDIEEMKSASIENFSSIVLKIDPEAEDKDKIVNDIQSAVDKADLPKDLLDDPLVREIESKDIPVIEISIAGNMSEAKLQEHAKVLEEYLLDIPAVSAVERTGWRDKEIWVEVRPEALEDYHIALSEIMEDIARRNVNMPGGKFVRGETEFLLRTTGQFETVEEIKKIILRSNEMGNQIRVEDIASVNPGFEEDQSISKTNGERAINLTVVKKQSADAIDLVNDVRKLVASYESSVSDPPQITLINDFSYYIKRRLNVLVQNGFLGVIFVLITLLLFLNPKVAIVTAIGIPIAFMMTFFAMLSLDISINLISMFGLIIVLGMLVDDAIVVSENVFRHVENGMPFKKAAYVGTSEVWQAVLSTVLTTIAAFAPLMFMTGIIGKFVWAIPVVVIIALTASLLQAFFILPVHLAEIGRIPKINCMAKLTSKLHLHRPTQLLNIVTNWYVVILMKAVKKRYLVTLGVVVLLVGSIVIAKFFLPVILFPARGIDSFFVRARLPVGTPLEVTEKKFRELEKLVDTIPRDEMDDYFTQIGLVQDDPSDPFTERATHVGQITVFLKPSADRKRETSELVEELRQKSKAFTGYDELAFDEPVPGPPVGRPVMVRLRGENLEVLNKLADQVKAYLKTVSGVKDIKDDYELGKGEWRIVVNEEEAAKAGLMIGEIARSVRHSFDGGIATTIKKADEEIDVRVRLPYGSRYDETSLSKVRVPNPYGHLTPLDVVASFKEEPGVSAIKHYKRRRNVNVTAGVDQDIITSVQVTEKLKEHFKDFAKKNPGYTISYGGEYEETQKSMNSLMKAFALSILLIFMILATNFKSIVQPIIVMMAIPFGLIGVFVVFMIHGMPLSFLALLGIVGLSGVVVNSSIILMDFINKARSEGMNRYDAIREAGRIRVRPVLITAITTVVGLFPIAYGLWGSDPILIPAALALMWGLIFATGLTLIVIPCFYTIFDDIREKLSFMKFWGNNNH